MKKGLFSLAILACGILLVYGSLATISAGDSDKAERGRTLYFQHCAGCHGNDAAGNGSASAKIKTTPPSLKKLKGSDGKFPLLKVQNIIQGDINDSASKTRAMPVWGKYFKDRGGKSIATSNIYALAKYLESFQPE